MRSLHSRLSPRGMAKEGGDGVSAASRPKSRGHRPSLSKGSSKVGQLGDPASPTNQAARSTTTTFDLEIEAQDQCPSGISSPSPILMQER